MLLIGKLKCEIETLDLLDNYMVLGMVAQTRGLWPGWGAELIGGSLCSLLSGPLEPMSLPCLPQQAFSWLPATEHCPPWGLDLALPDTFSSGSPIFMCVQHFKLTTKNVTFEQPTLSGVFPSSSLLFPSVSKPCFGSCPLTENVFLSYLLPALQDKHES